MIAVGLLVFLCHILIGVQVYNRSGFFFVGMLRRCVAEFLGVLIQL